MESSELKVFKGFVKLFKTENFNNRINWMLFAKIKHFDTLNVASDAVSNEINRVKNDFHEINIDNIIFIIDSDLTEDSSFSNQVDICLKDFVNTCECCIKDNIKFSFIILQRFQIGWVRHMSGPQFFKFLFSVLRGREHCHLHSHFGSELNC